MIIKKSVSLLFSLVIISLLLVGCNNSDATADLRAGEWKATNDFADITLTVNDDGTAITKAIVEYECGSGGISLSETLTLEASGEGWPIEKGKFALDFLDTSVQLKLTGTFNADNTQAAGTLKARSCSGKWVAVR